tara:strand:+ start:588 stop:986 length:399 start_codon:yes stop_codon:yes gene_type:complete
MDEFQLWSLWSSNKIGDALSFVGSILAIWLSLRIAAATRASNEFGILAKILASGFGLIVLASTWMRMTNGLNNWIIASNNLNALEDKSETAKGFVEYVGTTEIATTPTPMGIAFLVIVGLMILIQIWAPKSN